MKRAWPLLVVLAASCIAGPAIDDGPVTSTVSARGPAAVATSNPATATATPTLTFRNSASQARKVATVVAFIDAFNAGNVEAALALLINGASVNDCDYRLGSTVSMRGSEAIRTWLLERAVDHDHLELESIENDNADPSTGANVVSVTYMRRTSDSLRALGFGNGVTPRLVTKVVFADSNDRIRVFANGPGGTSELCQPR